MTMKRVEKTVARLLQAMCEREIGRPAPSFTHCLSVARKYDRDKDRPKTIDAYVNYIFDKEYP